MASDINDELKKLNDKITNLLNKYSELDEKDVRLVHLKILQSVIFSSSVSILIESHYAENNAEDLKKIFSGNEDEIKNYAHWFTQSITDNLLTTFVFQTEQLFRVFYGKLENQKPGEQHKTVKIFKKIFDDAHSNKEETKLCSLLWAVRNQVHTAGVYLKENDTLIYKGNNFTFEYGKELKFLKNGFLIQLLLDLLDAIEVLYDSEQIKNLGQIEHPNYWAVVD